MSGADTAPAEKSILVFSTNAISDPGIDLAGSAHMHYSTAVQVIPLPCSSGVRPSWIAHALESGFDGVFVAACGGDCAYLSDCTDRTGRVIAQAQDLLRERGLSPKRLKMSGLCSVCAENFVAHMENFQKELARLAAP
jgi:F420-non-reducing hydrogenase iron-sulfur subunit